MLTRMRSFRIWKHELPVIYDRPVPIGVPRDATIVSVDFQHGKLCLWEVHPVVSEPKTQPLKLILMTGTGIIFLMKEKTIFVPLKTFLLDGGNFVLHVFEILEGDA
jgi:hypothetical protein